MINHPNRGKKQTKAKAVPVTSAAPAPRSRGRTAADHDRDYSSMLIGQRESFDRATSGQTRLFTTDAAGLWDAYLAAIPAGQRQIHNCHCCRRFIETYGGLVGVDGGGIQWTVMWGLTCPEFYLPAFTALRSRVEHARVTGVFLTKTATWGTPETGEWCHLSVVPSRNLLHTNRALDPNQAVAAVRENVKTVMYAMAEFSPAVLDETLRVLESGQLTRSEKFLGPVRWLRELHNWPKGRESGKLRDNILWRSVALAPEGFCHIKSSVLGPLLTDVAAGLPFADIERKFNAMLHPLRYQRPQAAPAEGNVRAAEALFEKLGLARSLERRFARLDELPLEDAVWVPRILRDRDSRPVSKGSIFGHLKTRREETVSTVNLPTQTMTWDKFRRTVLLQSPESIDFLVPTSGPFMALTTATHEDALPIMKWDHEDERNPVSAYTYYGGSVASAWNLRASAWAPVNAIVAMPAMWGTKPKSHLAAGMMLLIDACRDTRTGQGNALFPENLRTEIHGARATIEAYSKGAELGGRDEASACGYGIGTGSLNITLRAKIGNAWSSYRIDRWD